MYITKKNKKNKLLTVIAYCI